MIKRSLYFGNPAYLHTRYEQLCIKLKDREEEQSAPIEDIALVVLDHPQITITQNLMAKLLAQNVALVTCDESHMPTGLFYNLSGHSLQSQKFKHQLEASLPLKKQLWQQTVAAKIANQAALLEQERMPNTLLLNYSKEVKSGDTENHEALAAAYYWKHLFPEFLEFSRHREGAPPNNLLNYGYAILRALVARSLVGSGLMPTLGIFHRNQYNAYCLADDIMEPYRPFVDKIVCRMVMMKGRFLELGPGMKKELLELPTLDVLLEGTKMPLLHAIQRSTTSLCKCFEGSTRRLLYPSFP
ncbi:MAG: type II CRISPR-associated endonuclease Cas1 [Bacteroidetes bacterium]|nr:type II CRISPR-associated endonuclease Cas1 [Bacteroidota bacterium]MBS1629154.1 type II CRISPR-associated endonuclease Cas1 [Bacteroidota bacterium]